MWNPFIEDLEPSLVRSEKHNKRSEKWKQKNLYIFGTFVGTIWNLEPICILYYMLCKLLHDLQPDLEIRLHIPVDLQPPTDLWRRIWK